MNESYEKLNEVLADEDFVTSLAKADSKETMQRMLKEKGVDVSAEALDIAEKILRDIADKKYTDEQIEAIKNGELPDELLEQVSGGLFLDGNSVLGGLAMVGGLLALGSFGLLWLENKMHDLSH